ncbi:DNA-methyltransferase [Halalkalibacterium halodurans]|uniref:DNA-methyltransferase n=1 Tax=Halalkalibacterium halodurans TaxID=86665 RepID=UPI002AAA2D04|nr:DNA methyltransferase [Halalkalibacterium halodurans]MDY7220678.1 DNA methyltransferase [Halalkalibacterium halodurans]MDY7239917.1 DNA methyltransferase [Halalkalibacterium halodurans]
MTGSLFKTLGIYTEMDLKAFSKSTKISTKKLKYYNEHNIFPSYSDFKKIEEATSISEIELKLGMGIFDEKVINAIQANSKQVSKIIEPETVPRDANSKVNHKKVFETELGELYQGDCLSLMDNIEKESIDLIFADPPFNLDKKYESGINDNISEQEYLKWNEEWILKCIDLLKEGGSLFIWNLPKWNTYSSNILNNYLEFKHWIAVDIKYRLPIKNRLYPSHYSLLYYTKGKKANTFNEQRLPLETCRHCAGDIRDYGGYKNKLSTKGINITDVWYDIPPVRHSKYKTRGSNELSLKLLERIISLTTNEGDTVFDPFGGSGTTYIASEILKRKWVGIEIGDTESIQSRFKDIEWQKDYIKKVQQNKNTLFTEAQIKKRIKLGHWLPTDFENEVTNKDPEQISLKLK